jgi:hypothetical protein
MAIFIGIDVGAHTGVAVWDGKTFGVVESMPLHRALDFVHQYAIASTDSVTVVFEDARQRTWFPKMTAAKDRARLQGAGSVKRDSTIWEDALTDWGIPFVKKAPKDNMTKLPAETFAKITGWTKRTNEHGRDAAMLVYGME